MGPIPFVKRMQAYSNPFEDTFGQDDDWELDQDVYPDLTQEEYMAELQLLETYDFEHEGLDMEIQNPSLFGRPFGEEDEGEVLEELEFLPPISRDIHPEHDILSTQEESNPYSEFERLEHLNLLRALDSGNQTDKDPVRGEMAEEDEEEEEEEFNYSNLSMGEYSAEEKRKWLNSSPPRLLDDM